MTFGSRIQHLRKEKGLSQEALAEKLAVTRQTISKWELDQSTPELDFISQLSDILDTSTDYLIKGTKRKENIYKSEPTTDAETQTQYKAKKSDTSKTLSGISLPSMIFTSGIVLICIGVIGIMIFVFASIMLPWIHTNEHGTFTGLTGFLLGNNFTGLFITFCAVCLFGIICVICAMILRGYKERDKS